MKIHLEYTAVLDVKNAENNAELYLPDDATIDVLLAFLEIQPAHRKFIVAAIDGERKSHSTTLSEGAKVLLSLPMGGG